MLFRSTHHAPRAEFDSSTIARNYWSLSTDRRFVVPAATVSLILGALFAMFSALPRVLIEGLDFTPMQLGLFFAGTVMIVFSAGIIATKIVPNLGLDRSISVGLALACVGGGMVLLLRFSTGAFCHFLSAHVYSCWAWAWSIRSAARRPFLRSAIAPVQPRRC